MFVFELAMGERHIWVVMHIRVPSFSLIYVQFANALRFNASYSTSTLLLSKRVQLLNGLGLVLQRLIFCIPLRIRRTRRWR